MLCKRAGLQNDHDRAGMAVDFCRNLQRVWGYVFGTFVHRGHCTQLPAQLVPIMLAPFELCGPIRLRALVHTVIAGPGLQPFVVNWAVAFNGLQLLTA